jgi:hypothetical protein
MEGKQFSIMRCSKRTKPINPILWNRKKYIYKPRQNELATMYGYVSGLF